MRLILICILCLLALPATAASWHSYSNARFGYAVAVPPGFQKADVGKRNADAVFKSTAEGTLSVWGMKVPGGDFRQAVAALMSNVQHQNWSLDQGGSAFDKNWFIFSATRGGEKLYEKAIALCGGHAVAGISLEYPAAEKSRVWPLLDKLGRSVRATKSGC